MESKLVPIKIRPNGAIIVDDSIRIDGDDYEGVDANINVAIYSHFHDDHFNDFEQAVGSCSRIYMTPETRAVAMAIFSQSDSNWIESRKNVMEVPINQEFEEDVNGKKFKIKLLNSNHILGSCQILIKTDEYSVLYSSDFMFKGTVTDEFLNSVKNVDYLILDSSHGLHSRNQKFDSPSIAKEKILKIAKEVTENKKGLIIRAHSGTMQKVMHWLDSEIDPDIPFLASEKEAKIAEVYSKFNFPIRNIENDEKWEQLYTSNHPFLRFISLGSGYLQCEITEPSVSSIRIGSSSKSNDGTPTNMHVVNIQEHADIDEVSMYVAKIAPKNVIIDNSNRQDNPDRAVQIKNEIEKIMPNTYLLPVNYLQK